MRVTSDRPPRNARLPCFPRCSSRHERSMTSVTPRHQLRWIKPLLAVIVTVFSIVSVVATASASPRIKACNLKAERYPDKVQGVCSASLTSDGIQMLFVPSGNPKEAWVYEGRYVWANGTATFPKGFLTGRFPPCRRITCWAPQTTRTAKIKLFAPRHCDRGGHVFTKVQVKIPGTKFESNPWEPGLAIPCMNPKPRPRLTWARCNWNGPGPYNILKAKGTTCRVANRVGKRAPKKLCRRKTCSWTPARIPWTEVRGTVRIGSWKCRAVRGWEFESARCRKGKRRLYRATGV